MRLQLSLLFLFIVIFVICTATDYKWRQRDTRRRRLEHRNRRLNAAKTPNEVRRSHRRSNRRHRQIHRFPPRDETTRLNCRVNEHWLKCGPEPHCEKSCDNILSPPHCHQLLNHPKCYYPRCVCDEGFVRNRDGYCIQQWKCQSRAYDYEEEDDTHRRFEKRKRKRFW